jgi:cytochrome c oxidase subunit 2
MQGNDKFIAALYSLNKEHTVNRRSQVVVGSFLIVIFVLLLTACTSRAQPAGTAWGEGVFASNGERIYFTATSESGSPIKYTGGPTSGGWMMMGGRLACVSCHGPSGQGGKHGMGMMQVMDAKDIRWSVLEGEFDAEKFRLSVVNGEDPDGTQLNSDMPRWNISDNDLADLIVFLKSLP